MKLFKSISLSIAITSAIFAFSSLAANAQTAQPNATPNSSNIKVATTQISPLADTNLSYNFTNLFYGSSYSSPGSLTRSSTGSVNLTLVQYPHSPGGTADCTYILYNGTFQSSAIRVLGNYTSTNKTITWNNIPAGTYSVRVSNAGPDADGNGYTN